MSIREEATEALYQIMGRVGGRLPDDWQTGFWVGSAWNIAEVIVDTRGRLSEKEQAVLLGAGGMMLRQALLESEAATMTDLLMSRVRQKGGDA